LDGSGDGGNTGAQELLQAGVEQDVDQQGNATYYPWFEWVAPTTLSNPTTGTIVGFSQSKQVLPDITPLAPALAGMNNNNLYLAWSGKDNDNLNIEYSSDAGRTFIGKKVFGDTSDAAPALCSSGDKLWLAWKGLGNDQLNVAQLALDPTTGAPTGAYISKQTLSSTSQSSPTLVALGETLYLGWRGNGNNVLCVSMSTDLGVTFGNEIVSSDTTSSSPTLLALDSQLFIGWKGDGNDQLNVATVDLTYETGVPTGFSNKTVLGQTSPVGPVLGTRGGAMFLAWLGDGNNNLNLAYSLDYGATWPQAYTSGEISGQGPALGTVLGELFYAWSGKDNLNMNVASVGLTGFSEPPYYSEALITNFPIKPGDYVTVSITYSGTSFGIIDFYNRASGQSFKLTLPKPPGVQMPGGTAEWIMEAINGGYPGTHLPQFSNVVFASAYACSQGDTTTGNPQTADTIIIENGATAMNTVTQGNDSLTITYVPLTS